jgi:hypothetical protein
VTERPSPLDALVDLVVYVPVGLAKTVAEEFPGLVAKGRATVEPQLGTARLIGQFVVAEGRKRATGLWGFPPAGSRSTPTSAAGNRSGSTAAEPDPGAPTSPPSAAPSPAEAAGTPAAARPPAPRRVARPARPPAADAPLPDGLAIPGYDSLSASQVVQRLAGLSSAELAAVGEYEAATRGRRTILARVGQLQGD